MVESNSVTIAGPVEAAPGCELRAVVDLRGQRSPSKTMSCSSTTAPDASAPRRCSPVGSSGFGTAPKPTARRLTISDARARHAEAVELLVERVEALLEVGEAVGADLAGSIATGIS